MDVNRDEPNRQTHKNGHTGTRGKATQIETHNYREANKNREITLTKHKHRHQRNKEEKESAKITPNECDFQTCHLSTNNLKSYH